MRCFFRAEGENYPPMHPNCRCTTVIADFTSGMRIARDPLTRKNYKVDGDMTFAEWKNSLTDEQKAAMENYVDKSAESGIIELTKRNIQEHISNPQTLFSEYTPETLKNALEQGGFDVKPLARGSLKGVDFTDGGGYKVNFGDGGLLQYHPASGSHHGGAYYKTSTGKGGTHRYDLDGKEK